MYRTELDLQSRFTGSKRFKPFNQAQVTHRETVQIGKSFQISRLKSRSKNRQ